jgi:hypothetical protein
MVTVTWQVEPRVAGGNVELEGELDHSLAPFRKACSSPFLVAGGHSRASAIAAVSSGQAGALLWAVKGCGTSLQNNTNPMRVYSPPSHCANIASVSLACKKDADHILQLPLD